MDTSRSNTTSDSATSVPHCPLVRYGQNVMHIPGTGYGKTFQYAGNISHTRDVHSARSFPRFSEAELVLRDEEKANCLANFLNGIKASFLGGQFDGYTNVVILHDGTSEKTVEFETDTGTVRTSHSKCVNVQDSDACYQASAGPGNRGKLGGKLRELSNDPEEGLQPIFARIKAEDAPLTTDYFYEHPRDNATASNPAIYQRIEEDVLVLLGRNGDLIFCSVSRLFQRPFGTALTEKVTVAAKQWTAIPPLARPSTARHSGDEFILRSHPELNVELAMTLKELEEWPMCFPISNLASSASRPRWPTFSRSTWPPKRGDLCFPQLGLRLDYKPRGCVVFRSAEFEPFVEDWHGSRMFVLYTNHQTVRNFTDRRAGKLPSLPSDPWHRPCRPEGSEPRAALTQPRMRRPMMVGGLSNGKDENEYDPCVTGGIGLEKPPEGGWTDASIHGAGTWDPAKNAYPMEPPTDESSSRSSLSRVTSPTPSHFLIRSDSTWSNRIPTPPSLADCYNLVILWGSLLKVNQDAPSEPTVTLVERRYLISGSRVTGFRTWEGSLHLASYLLTETGKELVKGKDILELGAGTGFLSILCAKHLQASHVTTTDGDEGVVEALKENIVLNGLGSDQHVVARTLNWGDDLEATWVKQDCKARPYDVVIGADITYDKVAIKALVITIHQLFELRPGLRVLISGVVRNVNTFESFRSECLSRRFSVKELGFQAKPMRQQKTLFYAAAVPIKILSVSGPG
ncbi:hypothetical protein DL770_010269 [Monosporascus sp. CRB-9-2]|nr:hypothetical protein DL770_010269 [Monosporascus sp. CRB-9-2]